MHEHIQLYLQSPYPVVEITTFRIEQKPNQHVFMDASILLLPDIENSTIENVTYGSAIRLTAVMNGEETDLFCGILYSSEVEYCGGSYTAKFKAVSGTAIMDNALVRRTFQDENMPYATMQFDIMSSYKKYHLIPTVDTNSTICAPLLQYDETDWGFFLRQASHFNTVMYAGCNEFFPQIWFGFPISQNTHQIDKRIHHEAFKDLTAYRKAKARGSSAGEADFISYRIKTIDRYNIGDEVRINGKIRYIAEKTTFLEKACVCYIYVLKTKESLFQPKYWNEKAFGLQLKGRVLDTQGEAVKTHFHIDTEQSVDEAFLFPFAPPTGSLMYCMPQHGTHIVVAYTELHEQTAQAWGCFRTNGQVATKTVDPNIRYLQTEHGSELEMTPTTMHFSGTEKTDGNLIFTLSDLLGNEFKSNTYLEMTADQEILIHSGKTVNISGTGVFVNSGLGGVIEVINDVDINGSTGFMFGNHVELYAPLNESFAELLAAVQEINKQKAEQDALNEDINRWQQEIDAGRTPDWWPLHNDDDWWITESQIDAWALYNQGYDRSSYNDEPITEQLGIADNDGSDMVINAILTAWQQSSPEERIDGYSQTYFESSSVYCDMFDKLQTWAGVGDVDLNTITYAQLDKIAIDHTMQSVMGQAMSDIITGVGTFTIAAAPYAANAVNKQIDNINNYRMEKYNNKINNPYSGRGALALAGGGIAGDAIAIPWAIPQVAVWSPAVSGAVSLNASASILFAAALGGPGGGKSIEDIIKEIPNKFKKNLKCKEFANSLEKIMKEEGIQGERIHVKSETGFVYSDKNGAISSNGTHDAIRIGDTVYDNLNPNGISYDDWAKDLGLGIYKEMSYTTSSIGG